MSQRKRQIWSNYRSGREKERERAPMMTLERALRQCQDLQWEMRASCQVSSDYHSDRLEMRSLAAVVVVVVSKRIFWTKGGPHSLLIHFQVQTQRGPICAWLKSELSARRNDRDSRITPTWREVKPPNLRWVTMEIMEKKSSVLVVFNANVENNNKIREDKRWPLLSFKVSWPKLTH